jgi:hypothetical protein
MERDKREREERERREREEREERACVRKRGMRLIKKEIVGEGEGEVLQN